MENKYHRNPRACILIHAYVHACPSSVYACIMHTYTRECIQMLGFQKLWKTNFFALKFGFRINPTSFRSRSKPLFYNYKKSYMELFQNTQKILKDNTRFTRNSELKREFFTKHHQVNIFLIWAFFGLDLRVPTY